MTFRIIERHSADFRDRELDCLSQLLAHQDPVVREQLVRDFSRKVDQMRSQFDSKDQILKALSRLQSSIIDGQIHLDTLQGPIQPTTLLELL